MSDIETLKHFYESISSPEGIRVIEFQAQLKSLFEGCRSNCDIKAYRLGKQPWKKLRDEVVPVSQFLKYRKFDADRIRFPLDNHTPDSWLILTDGEQLGVEVTIERGREKYHLARELNDTGSGRGFIGIQDDASKVEFDDQMSNQSNAYSTDQALDATKKGIITCLEKKNAPRFKNVHLLLIQTNFVVLPKEYWGAIVEDISIAAAKLPFREIHVVGDTDEEPWGFRVK